ncbi:MAG: GspE/PulE family protein [Vicingaceae bacterium]
MAAGDLKSISVEVIQQVTSQQAWQYRIIPLSVTSGEMHLLVQGDHWNENIKEEIELLFGKNVAVEFIEAALMTQLLSNHYRKSRNQQGKMLQSEISRSDDFLLFVIHQANDVGSSDIHVERYEDRCRIRLRIDGKLTEQFVIPGEDYPAMINKIKIKARLDISEKRLPQDGRIEIREGHKKFDLRVSVLPTLYGEKVVLRILSRDATDIDLTSLGFNEIQLKAFEEAIRKPNGMVLISGPTGSGKTTTLYASLKILNNVDTNILTIEDPVEYTLEGINQVQLKEDIGLGFTDALRSFLRQDPDIIMLGEIRDEPTAQMAIRAALTGHLVLSTIHTNSAWSTVSRLVDMGIPPYLLASTLNASVAQRLVRLLCPECKSPEILLPEDWPASYSRPPVSQHFRPKGCPHCHDSGFYGRKAIYEVIPINGEFAECIKNSAFNVRELLKKHRVTPMADQAIKLFSDGQTSLEEIHHLLNES